MRRMIQFLAVLVSSVVFPAFASALCDFNIAAVGRARIPMVRAYQPCPGPYLTSPNTETDSDIDACAPVQPVEEGTCTYGGLCRTDVDCHGGGSFPDECNKRGPTPYKFGPEGECTISARSKIVKDCSKLPSNYPQPFPAQPCHVTYVTGACRDVQRGDGSPIASPDDADWTLLVTFRMTSAQPMNGDVVQIDFPAFFTFSDPEEGAFNLRGNLPAALAPLIGPVGAALPPCTQLEIVELSIRDPARGVFARPGLAARP
jgi:hypothetical protein